MINFTLTREDQNKRNLWGNSIGSLASIPFDYNLNKRAARGNRLQSTICKSGFFIALRAALLQLSKHAGAMHTAATWLRSLVHIRRRSDGEKFKFAVFPRLAGTSTYMEVYTPLYTYRTCTCATLGRVARTRDTRAKKRQKERERERKGVSSRLLSRGNGTDGKVSPLSFLSRVLLSDWILAIVHSLLPSLPLSLAFFLALEPFKKQRINLHICMRSSKNFDASSGAKCFFAPLPVPLFFHPLPRAKLSRTSFGTGVEQIRLKRREKMHERIKRLRISLLYIQLKILLPNQLTIQLFI